ncbi:hypothetical protein ABZW32_37130 [Streptomyces sp. NPDC004667]|uniref:hypothetical protein n=1 Tax=Streptomyces sp. NPDC004667 TaxID=3154285 RepID=UPI0033A86690
MALLRGMGRTLGKWTGRPATRLRKDSGDPEVARAREAAAAADWATVRGLFEAHPEGGNRTELLWAVADTAGVERWIVKAVEAEPRAALPRVLAGFRHITWGWEARTGALAKHVSREQFDLFHGRLRLAEQWFYEAAEREPQWSSPWYGLQITGRGLQVGPTLAQRRFEAAVRRAPHHLGAHSQQLQQVCKKWGGSDEQMHAFARESAAAAPGGSALGMLVPDAHLEQWLMLDAGADGRYMGRPDVSASLHEAAAHSFRHPDFERLASPYQRIQVLNSFAMAFSLAGERSAARECFEATDGNVTESPWQYLNGSDPVAAYRKHRSAAGR